MLSKHIYNIIVRNIGYEPTNDQSKVVDILSKFILPMSENQILIVDGHAGTGKTTLIKALVYSLEEMKISYELMAPTGRAAKVISSYCNRPAFTIHKKIYRQKDKSLGFGNFVLNFNTHKNAIFIVDEASMISNQTYENSNFGSGNLLNDLISFVFSKPNCKLVLVGDTAQLPPVGTILSPALNIKEVESFSYNTIKVSLKQVVRQEENSGILKNATSIRNNIENKNNNLNIIECVDVERITGVDLIEKLNESYNKKGIQESIVICRTNKQANQYNQGIRNRILYREEEISQGDLLMVVKNSYNWLPENSPTSFIANGDIIKICRIHKFEEMHGFRFCEATIKLIDFSDFEIRVYLMLDSISAEGPTISKEQANNLYNSVLNDYSDEKSFSKRYEKLRSDKYFNALQVKFAYAITCHKAQGGQWEHVYLDSSFFSNMQIDIEYLRWLYTAFTRSTKNIFLVNFPDNFFKIIKN